MRLPFLMRRIWYSVRYAWPGFESRCHILVTQTISSLRVGWRVAGAIHDEAERIHKGGTMSVIPALDLPRFEAWIIKTYPSLFGEWEREAAEFVDLDQWLEHNHYTVIDAWRRYHATK